MNILLKCPSRQRSIHLENSLNSFYLNIGDRKHFHFLISLDKDDREIPRYKEVLNNYENLTYVIRKCKNKIGALNRDLNEITFKWDIVLIFCDDTICGCYGFDNFIREDFEKYFPDLDGVIYHDPSLSRHGYEIAYHPSIGRKYYERFNYLFYPEYTSFCADIDLTEVAVKLGKYKRVDDKRIVIHKKLKGDILYAKYKPIKNSDLIILEKRRSLGFGI